MYIDVLERDICLLIIIINAYKESIFQQDIEP